MYFQVESYSSSSVPGTASCSTSESEEAQVASLVHDIQGMECPRSSFLVGLRVEDEANGDGQYLEGPTASDLQERKCSPEGSVHTAHWPLSAVLLGTF